MSECLCDNDNNYTCEFHLTICSQPSNSQPITYDDFETGLDKMLEGHEMMANAGMGASERFSKSFHAMRATQFTDEELRGMLAAAVERLFANDRSSTT